ncbi:B3 domain-containing protein At1g05920-like [Rhodamnia argentea]|uniref:B3 domain-containing protein At1g05920-like n=1 Tax=Rhodamnia argentea TaxID=178133 RepID=A0A8B8PB87_9MYRT|nr:B3 domain-containing protein At1g05920-like [Rhodamnia argentea]
MGIRSIPVAMVFCQFTDGLSKKEREMELDLSSLHLLADAAALVSEGKLSLPSSFLDLDDEKKETAVKITFGPTWVGWVVRKKRTPLGRGPTFHAQKLNSDPVVSKQETWRGHAEHCKKRPRALYSTEAHEVDRVSKKPKRTLNKNLEALSELPTIFMDKILEMRGRDVRLVVEKKLSPTDMNPGQSRLSIPKSQVLTEFLNHQEIITLDNKGGIKISLVDPCLEVHHGLQLKKWRYSSKTFSYVLTNRWNAVAHPHKQNGLKEDGLVRLWSFRVDGNLFFCLTKVEEASVEGSVAPLTSDRHSFLGSIS